MGVQMIGLYRGITFSTIRWMEVIAINFEDIGYVVLPPIDFGPKDICEYIDNVIVPGRYVICNKQIIPFDRIDEETMNFLKNPR